MIRFALLASLLFFLPPMAFPQAAEAPKPALPTCNLTQDAENCVRFLACIGKAGLWMDGQAHGWNTGTLVGLRNDGIFCTGEWSAGTGPGGAGTAEFFCSDNTSGEVIYVAQDSLTGTAIARGTDSAGREVRAWSGAHVLRFLGDGDVNAAKLPCTDAPLLLSRY